MNSITILTDVDGAFKDLQDKRDSVIHLRDPVLAIGRLPKGMASGKSSVMIRIDLPDGKVVIAEISLDIFLNCAGIFDVAEKGGFL